MSQPIANVGVSYYVYPCGKKKQYLCTQSPGEVITSNYLLIPNQSWSLPSPSTILPVPTKIHISGFVYLASAAPLGIYLQVYNIYGNNYSVSLNFEVSNNGTVINIPEQEVVLEPYAFTTVSQGAGLTIVPLATVTINQFNAYVYVEVPEE
ncbi:MAG: hypothetical protein QXX36_03700 [Candidatus Rehaiarchaeum fermentans]|nr:hypothetical protein [Candidatus Rehaiarchaeum fermentans]